MNPGPPESPLHVWRPCAPDHSRRSSTLRTAYVTCRLRPLPVWLTPSVTPKPTCRIDRPTSDAVSGVGLSSSGGVSVTGTASCSSPKSNDRPE